MQTSNKVWLLVLLVLVVIPASTCTASCGWTYGEHVGKELAK